jgi:bacillithiol biosynthesis cysteine-adding enzyme BshC
MKAHFIPRTKTTSFTEQQLLLSENQNALQEFIGIPFSREAFPKQIELKKASYPTSNRAILQTVLLEKYNSLENNSKALENINHLKNEHCFTITTGHQLSLMTGPLYFVYKILHVIKQCQELNAFYPNYRFVPIYWMASEDHDFEEIRSFSLFGKSITWETEQNGAVGRMNLSGMAEVHETVKQFFANHPESEIHQLLDKLNGNTYGEAFFKFVHTLFSDFGLVIIDGDQKEFKKQFSTVIRDEIETQFSFEAVEVTNKKLEQKNLKIQIHPRELNLFFLSENNRERIIPIGADFQIGSQKFTKEQLLELLEKQPESFSPNVVLRPLYQEFLLPNLCYVGGVGELSYWLQFKGVFNHAKIPYPLIQARTSALWIDSNSAQKMENFKLSIEAIFKSKSELIKQFLLENEEESIDFSLIDFQFNQFKKDFELKTESIDSSMNTRVGAEFTRIEKQIDGLKAQLEKSVKSKHEKGLKSIEQLKDKLFPNNALQERIANFFQFCPDGNYKQKLHDLFEAMQPFSSEFLVIKEISNS